MRPNSCQQTWLRRADVEGLLPQTDVDPRIVRACVKAGWVRQGYGYLDPDSGQLLWPELRLTDDGRMWVAKWTVQDCL